MGKRACAAGIAACVVALGLTAWAEPVDLAGGDLRVAAAADLAADGYVNSGAATATLTLDFDDDVAAMPSVSGAIRLVKLGAGTVTFASAQEYTGGTVVSNGFVSASNPDWVGEKGTTVTLAGGGLAIPRAEGSGISVVRSIVVTPGAAGTLAGAGGGDEVYFSCTSVCFKAATLRLTPVGEGVANFAISRNGDYSSYQSSGLATGGTLVVEPNAQLNLYPGDSFGGANHQTDITLRIREGGVVTPGGTHAPLTRNVILEGGGRITAPKLPIEPALSGGVETMTTSATWLNVDFTRTLTVVPGSLTGAAEAIVDTPYVHLAPLNQEAAFVVEKGAALVVDASLWPAHAQSGRSLRKRGPGTMELRRPLNIGGHLIVEEGVLRLAGKTSIGSVAGLQVAPGARIELEDGTVLDATPNWQSPGGFLASADVWFDATQLSGYANGATVSSTPNLGASGGTFGAFPFGNDFDRPTYAASALNGKPAIYCKGGSGGSGFYLGWTNRTDKMTVYLVMRWDGWENEEPATGHQGRNYWWHGPISMGPATFDDESIAGEDYGRPNRFYLQWSGDLGTFGCYGIGVNSSPYGTFDGEITADNTMAIGVVRDGKTMRARTWWTDAYPDFNETSADNHPATAWDIGCIGLGTRLRWENGKVRPNSGRALKGWIGELIVFSRALTDDETAYVERYLQRKWGKSEQAAVAAPSVDTPSVLDVTVADGATATANLAGGVPASEQMSADRRLAKLGAGTLEVAGAATSVERVDVREGRARLASAKGVAAIWVDASDAGTVTLADDGETVLSVRNKGLFGGAFTQNPHPNGTAPLCPLPKYGTIGDLGAIKFDGNSALALEASPAETTRREFFVCAALVRDSYVDEGGKGKWGGPLAFFTTSATGLDIDGTTGFHTEDNIENGQTKLSVNSKGGFSGHLMHDIADGTPYVFALWESGIASGTSSGKAAGVDVANATNGVDSVASLQNGATSVMQYDIVQMGGRLCKGGAPQWTAVGNLWNRMWDGRIGEFIAFDRQPSRDQVAATLAYLRKKWLGAGDGSATPPAFLAGESENADENATPAAWDVSSGATLATAQPAQTLGPVALADGAALARENAATAETFRLFDTPSISFGGAVTLTAPAFPLGDATILTADSATGSPAWTLVGEKAAGRSVSRRGSDFVIAAPGLFIFIR